MAEKKGKEVTVSKVKSPAPAAERADAPRRVGGWESELERFFDELRFPWPRLLRAGRRGYVQPPAIDVIDENDHIIVKAELPGMSKDDIQVELTDSTLVIKGEKKHEKEVKEENYYRSEREYGSVYRSMTLPAEVKTQDVSATFKDGVLEIRMPKTDAAKRSRAVKVPVR